MPNNYGSIIHIAGYKKGKRHIISLVYKKNHPVILKEVVNVFDVGYLGVEKDFPAEQKSSLPYRKKGYQELSEEEKE